jgi:colicin import membrane protein
MGKDSLIKSTTKKKTKKEAPAKKPTAKKTTTSKAPAKAPKDAAKNKSVTKAVPKPAPPKTKASPKPKARPAAPIPSKSVTIKALLSKSFGPISKAAKPMPRTVPKTKIPSAPPLVTASDPKEAARIRALLRLTHSMADVTAAAKAPEAPTPVTAKAKKKTVPPDKAAAPIPTAAPSAGDLSAFVTDVKPEPDPVSRAIKLLAVGVGAIILLVLMVSNNNSSKYYIQPKDKTIEIWKGRFSPKDKKLFMILHGIQLSNPIKDVYTQNEVFPLIFTYYLDKADTLLEVPGLPDFDGIKTYLRDAKKYAIDDTMRKNAGSRLNNIERMTLLYKADVAISKRTVTSLEAAIKHLTSAKRLITNPTQAQEIDQKLTRATNLKAALKAKPTQKEK